MRIKGTNKHLIFHRRRINRKHGTTKCWFRGKRTLMNCYGEHDRSRIKNGKGGKKFYQKDFFWEIRMEL